MTPDRPLGTEMARNIEIKARISSVEAVEAMVSAIADDGPTEIIQDDTYFRCEGGKLKLRTFSDKKGELIFYRRDDRLGPAESFYVRSPIPTPDILRQSLTLAYGQVGRVRKHRTVFMVGRTRVHVDRVTDLGDFLELEVVLGDDDSCDAGVQEANGLLERLGIEPSQLVECGYLELLAARGGGGVKCWQRD